MTHNCFSELFCLKCRNDETRQPLSRKVSIPSSRINPYRMVIILRLVILSIFLHYRITNPVRNAYALWLLSVICEIWFAMSWILDQFPKWFPVNRETYLDRLVLRWFLISLLAIIVTMTKFAASSPGCSLFHCTYSMFS